MRVTRTLRNASSASPHKPYVAKPIHIHIWVRRAGYRCGERSVIVAIGLRPSADHLAGQISDLLEARRPARGGAID